jgi:hypothetical protein
MACDFMRQKQGSGRSSARSASDIGKILSLCRTEISSRDTPSHRMENVCMGNSFSSLSSFGYCHAIPKRTQGERELSLCKLEMVTSREATGETKVTGSLCSLI